MNAIVSQLEIELYNDVTRSARYQRYEIDRVVNDAMRIFMDNVINNEKNKKSASPQGQQMISDELFTLQKRQSAAPTLDIALYPTDYYSLLDIFATLDGVSVYCRPTDQNKIGPRLADAFDPPSGEMPFYLQQTTGFQIYHGTSTITNVDVDYYKTPATFTIGTDSQLINAGAGVLTLAAVYIATEVSVHNGVTYNVGAQFTAANTNLTSGQVILASNTTPIELPAKTHEAVCKIAVELLSGAVTDYNKSAWSEKQAGKA